MTIRDEIESILMKPIYSDKVTDEIIKLFENLIDEKIQECKNENFAESDEAVGILEELKESLNQ